MTNKKQKPEKEFTYIPHNEFVSKLKKKGLEKHKKESLEKELPYGLNEYVTALNKCYRDNDVNKIFSAITDLENEEIKKLLNDPYGDHYNLFNIGGLTFGERSSFNAGFLEGLKLIQKFREEKISIYKKWIEKLEKENTDEN